MHAKCTIPRQKIKKNSGEGAQPPPHWGKGHPLPKLHPLGASIRGAYGARPCPPQTKVLDPPVMPGAINFNDADIKRAGLPVQGPVSDSGWDVGGVGLKLRQCSASVGGWER